MIRLVTKLGHIHVNPKAIVMFEPDTMTGETRIFFLDGLERLVMDSPQLVADKIEGHYRRVAYMRRTATRSAIQRTTDHGQVTGG